MINFIMNLFDFLFKLFKVMLHFIIFLFQLVIQVREMLNSIELLFQSFVSVLDIVLQVIVLLFELLQFFLNISIFALVDFKINDFTILHLNEFTSAGEFSFKDLYFGFLFTRNSLNLVVFLLKDVVVLALSFKSLHLLRVEFKFLVDSFNYDSELFNFSVRLL